jgi:hypothetical protein
MNWSIAIGICFEYVLINFFIFIHLRSRPEDIHWKPFSTPENIRYFFKCLLLKGLTAVFFGIVAGLGLKPYPMVMCCCVGLLLQSAFVLYLHENIDDEKADEELEIAANDFKYQTLKLQGEVLKHWISSTNSGDASSMDQKSIKAMTRLMMKKRATDPRSKSGENKTLDGTSGDDKLSYSSVNKSIDAFSGSGLFPKARSRFGSGDSHASDENNSSKTKVFPFSHKRSGSRDSKEDTIGDNSKNLKIEDLPSSHQLAPLSIDIIPTSSTDGSIHRRQTPHRTNSVQSAWAVHPEPEPQPPS